MEQLAKIRTEFLNIYGNSPEIMVAAPGRVNLIGEHTDYNEGYVLPMAIDRRICMAARRRADGQFRLHAAQFGQTAVFPGRLTRKTDENPWANYFLGVVNELYLRRLPVPGLDVYIDGNVPVGAGLSSSAAMEVASLTMLRALSGFEMDGREAARLCQRAENDFVGMKCGIMDQFISLQGQAGHALFLDCRSLEYNLVPLQFQGYCFVAGDTRVRRGLVTSEYNTRRSECEDGVHRLKAVLPAIKSLRDVPAVEFQLHQGILPAVVARRCAHVIRENQRVLRCVETARLGDVQTFGQQMNESHQSLRDLYEVSCRELDCMTALAIRHGALGSRMTGAGFGGCTISLVREEGVEEFMARTADAYRSETGLEPALYTFSPAGGAAVLHMEKGWNG